jgi:hypothetical protein
LALSIRDGSLNPTTLATNFVGGAHIPETSATDPSTGLSAQVANHTAQNQSLGSTAYGLLVGAIGKLMNVIGTNFDVWRGCGFDLGSPQGVPAVGPLLGAPVLATTSSSVGSGIASVTLAMTTTTGFVAGAPVNLEPGTASYESARIRSVIANTSITVDFPPGGALFAHAGSFQLQTFQLNQARQASGAVGVAAVNAEGTKPTFRYALTGITPVATPTDFLVIQGSATVTGRIKTIYIDGHATAAGKIPVQFMRRSTAGTLGSAVLNAITPMKHGPNDAAPALTVSYVSTANYTTLGTLVAQGGVRRLFLNTDAAGANLPALWAFADQQDKPILVEGTSDFLCVNFNGAALPTGCTIDLEVETEEGPFGE